MPWMSVGDWEVNPALLAALLPLCHERSRLHCGPSEGDVLRVALQDLDLSADGLVSGPPCPPYSSIGHRLLELDPRSSVFVAIALWCVHLAQHGSLAFFVLENVEGIMRKRKQDAESFGEWFCREMASAMPSGWEIKVQHHNSRVCMLPQSRPRVFFVGTSPAMRADRCQRRVLSAPLLSWPLTPSESPHGFLANPRRESPAHALFCPGSLVALSPAGFRGVLSFIA